MICFGQKAGFALELQAAKAAHPELAGLGWMGLRLWLGGAIVWSGDEDVFLDWTWLDLVEHLARAWSAILWEDTIPFGLQESDPEKLRKRSLLQSVRGHSAEEVEGAVHGWQHRHNLASGVMGLYLPAVWIQPSGHKMRMLAEGREVILPRSTVLETLERFAEHVLSVASLTPHPRHERATTWWQERVPDERVALRMRTGLEPEMAQQCVPEGESVAAWWRLEEDDSELMVAARLMGRVPVEHIQGVLRAISVVPKHETPALDALTREMESLLPALQGLMRYEQGYRAALWLRERLVQLNLTHEPEALLTEWGVALAELSETAPHLDAVAVWGRHHGPAILLNPAGRHVTQAPSRRATLAHEIAHLLLDRHTHLPAVDVLGGDTPQHVEQRARAFAAEFLLPREEVETELADVQTRDESLRTLCERHGVSKQLAGWQIKNSMVWDSLTPHHKKLVSQWCRKGSL